MRLVLNRLSLFGMLGAALGVAPGAAGQVQPLPTEEPEALRPTGGLVEIGLFGGALWVSENNALHDPRQPFANFDQPSPEIGVRAAYYPLAFLGLEGELMGAIANATGESGVALGAVRAHVIGQLPTPYVQPFALVGAGRMAMQSDLFGSDDDPAFHFGLGAKASLHRRVSIRLDLRDTLTKERLAADSAHHFEVLGGVSIVLGRAPAKPADSDGDGVVNLQDLCPLEPGLLPDGCPLRDADGDGFVDSEDQCPGESGVAPDGCPVRDADGDGVTDDVDECRDVAGVAPTGCPDSDGDGILDRGDRCPQTPGIAPEGCPADSDGDGFVDDNDACPLEPETVNGFEDSDGCPDEVPQLVQQFTGVMEGISFASGRADISPASLGLLERAAAVLLEYPALRVRIVGHTDSTGGHDLNVELSLARANAVRTFLVGQGVEAERIGTLGMGPDEPIADNATKEGRSKNRRIEFILLKADEPL